MTVMYDSDRMTLFFENLRTKHSRTLFDTVMPASHKIKRRLKLEVFTPLLPPAYFKKALCKGQNKDLLIKNYTPFPKHIFVSIHFRENLKASAESPWKMQSFGIWYIFVGQILSVQSKCNWKKWILRNWLFSTKLHFTVVSKWFSNIYEYSDINVALKVFDLQRCTIYQKIPFFMGVQQILLDFL